MNLNKQLLMGHLGKDPEIRYTQNGKPVATLSVATNYFKRKEGADPEKFTVWFKVVVWGDRVESYISKFKKGDLVYVEGETREDEWEDKNGNKRKNKYVLANTVKGIFIGKNDAVKPSNATTSIPASASKPNDAIQETKQDVKQETEEDDLPF